MSYATNFGVVPQPVYAGFGARLAAAVIDCTIVWYAARAALGGFDALCTRNALLGPQDQAAFAQLARPAALLAYFIAFEGGVGATLGKMMMQLRVRAADGQAMGFGRAAGRNLAKAASLAPFGLGFMLCMFPGRRQALHDLLAASIVVRA